VARCGIVGVAVALIFAGNAAADGPSQPDVTIRQRGDAVPAGDDLYGADAVGQTRSLIIERRVVVVVRVQNDGSSDATYAVTVTPPAPGFDVRFLVGRLDATQPILNGTFVFEAVRAGRARTLVVRVTAMPGTPLGAEQDLLVTATSTTDPGQIDAARATITKV
jgi:hypothetical protein